MWFYELRDRLYKGLRVALNPVPQVEIGLDCQRKLILPLGRSIRQFIVGDETEDGGNLLLRHGNLKETTQGLVFTHQSLEEAKQDGRALLLVNLLADSDEGEALHFHRRGPRHPKVLEKRVVVFEPGEAITISYISRIAPAVTHLHWDGRYLNSRQVLEQPLQSARVSQLAAE